MATSSAVEKEGNNNTSSSKSNGNNNDEWKSLLSKWDLSQFSDSFNENGWTYPIDWYEIQDTDLYAMGLKKGHIVRFKRCFKEYSRLKYKQQSKVIKLTTVNPNDFTFNGGSSSSTHSNLTDIRSGNPSQTTFAYFRQRMKAERDLFITSINFSYRYMIGYKGPTQGPMFQLIAEKEESKESHIIYSSPQLSVPNYDDNNSIYSNRVVVAANKLPKITLSEPIKFYFRFVNHQRNMHLDPYMTFEIVVNA